jgi:Cu-processing system ATP-binding protein
MIKITNLRKSYGQLDVLKGIDTSFNHPGIYAVLGPNGSGKTTLMKSILGLVLPQEGTISFAGKDVRDDYNYRSLIGYLPQIARFPENLTVRELLNMIKDLGGKGDSGAELITLFGLTEHINKKLRNLSGGTRQKVNLVQAFMADSPVYLLDEPTAGLDPLSLIFLKDLLRRKKEEGKIILVTTHIMSFVQEMADEIRFLLEGTIYYEGSTKSLLQRYGTTDLELAVAKLVRGDEPIITNGKSNMEVHVPVFTQDFK